MKIMMSLAALCIAVYLTGCATTSDSMSASPGAVTECTADCDGPCCKGCGDDCSKPCCDADTGMGAVSDDGDCGACPMSGKKSDATNMGAVGDSECSATKSSCGSSQSTCGSK